MLLVGQHARAAEGEVLEPDELQDGRLPHARPQDAEGARVIGADEAEALLKAGEAVFIDVFPRAPKPPNLPEGTVWRDPTHMTIDGAHWMPNVGYGVLSPEFESYFRTRLAQLTNNDTAKPVVFFCLKDCWMSWNAGKRAVEWGYTA